MGSLSSKKMTNEERHNVTHVTSSSFQIKR